VRRSPGEARLLGLWTAGCLAVLLLAGIVWVGDLALQWPVFVVPLAWALVAARPRRRAAGVRSVGARAADDDPFPVTREAPTLPPPPEPHRRDL
jgi:hypothetical protein